MIRQTRYLLIVSAAIMVIVFKIVESSGTIDITTPPDKVSSTKTVEILSLDLCNTLNTRKSPLKLIDENTKVLGLDFDDIGKDSIFPCALFGDQTIAFEEHWTEPLKGHDHIENIINLENKMKEISRALKKEPDHFSSGLKSFSSYVMVINSSISQLAYLISRLRSTFEVSESVQVKLRKITLDHLKALMRFASDLFDRSSRFASTNVDDQALVPTEYFNDLLTLRCELLNSGFDDEMFENFVNYFYEVFGKSHCEFLNNSFIEWTMSDFWIPLPMEYLRYRMFYDNHDHFDRFVSNWILKAFNGPKFDSRHLIDFGSLLQQGFISYETLSTTMGFAHDNGHQSQYKLNEEMVKFLSLLASTPWLLPFDLKPARFIGDFSTPQIEHHSKYSDAEKAAIIENIWRFFVNPAELANMLEDDYENLCRLINRFDKAFPGISGKLWSLFGDSKNERNGLNFVKEIKSKIEHLGKESENLNWRQKLYFLRTDLEIVEKLKDLKLDSASLYFLVEFVTEIMSNTYEELSAAIKKGQVHFFEKEIKELLSLCINFTDLFLERFLVKSVIVWWYANYEYNPTALCAVLFDLWMTDFASNLNEEDSLIFENLSKLVDFNLKFAREFMLMRKSKTLIHLFPAFSGKASTPKILIETGESDTLNLELFRSYIQVAESAERDGDLWDFFFVSLSQKLTSEEISFESALELFLELEAKFGTIKFDISRIGYANFWNPNLIITSLKHRSNPAVIGVFEAYLKIVRMQETLEISAELLKNLSTFTYYFPEIDSAIVLETPANVLQEH